MFRCQKCDQVVGPHVPATRVPAERRSKVYPLRLGVNQKENPKDLKPGQLGPADDPGGKGWEIVREAVVCPGCVGEA